MPEVLHEKTGLVIRPATTPEAANLKTSKEGSFNW